MLQYCYTLILLYFNIILLQYCYTLILFLFIMSITYYILIYVKPYLSICLVKRNTLYIL